MFAIFQSSDWELIFITFGKKQIHCEIDVDLINLTLLAEVTVKVDNLLIQCVIVSELVGCDNLWF